jgi:hypothetical protein
MIGPEWDDHDLGKLPDYKDNGRMTQDWRQSKKALAELKSWSINLAELGQAFSHHIQLNLL